MNFRFSQLVSIAAVTAAAITLGACSSGSDPVEQQSGMTAVQKSELQKQQVTELLKSIETGDTKPLSYINPNKYIQHNVTMAEGLAGFTDTLKQLPRGSARVNTVRVFGDGNYVFAHSDYNFFGPKVGFDIFRFEDGKIVEHWDNLQEKPTAPNPSGNTMLNGPTAAKDLDKTEKNKELVRNFITDVLINGKAEMLTSYIDGENYTQHHPQIANGVSGLIAALEAMAKAGIAMKYDRIHKVLGEGNFVLIVSEGSYDGKWTSFYDMYRIENNKIVEHWDTIEALPPMKDWKNKSGKF